MVYEKKIGTASYLTFVALLLFLEFVFLSMIFSLFPLNASAGVGSPNTTMQTRLQVGSVYPEILNVTILDKTNGIDLIANSTKKVVVYVYARDYNGEKDIVNVSGWFFDPAVSSWGATDDNNNHYTNRSCDIDYTYGDEYNILANCTFDLWYYANNATWNLTIIINDTSGLTDIVNSTVAVNTLFAIGVPDYLDYGIVNGTRVSDEKIVNITNFGNNRFNLSLSGYAFNISDNLAMNCTLGAIKNISIGYEKFNLTGSNVSQISLAQMENLYLNLTSSPAIKTFDLNYRQNDSINDAINASYWRIYVPRGVAGNCTGNVILGAVKGLGN